MISIYIDESMPGNELLGRSVEIGHHNKDIKSFIRS